MEQWEPIPGYEGEYSISTHGRVRSEERMVEYRPGRFRRYHRRLKAPCYRGSLSTVIYLFRNNRQKCLELGKLVATVFLGPCPRRRCLIWVDGNKRNNRLSNLRYVTQVERVKYRYTRGYTHVGSNNPRSRLTEADIPNICNCYTAGETQSSIARRYGVGNTAIYLVVHGYGWAHVRRPPGRCAPVRGHYSRRRSTARS
jgi:hypothetical protein